MSNGKARCRHCGMYIYAPGEEWGECGPCGRSRKCDVDLKSVKLDKRYRLSTEKRWSNSVTESFLDIEGQSILCVVDAEGRTESMAPGVSNEVSRSQGCNIRESVREYITITEAAALPVAILYNAPEHYSYYEEKGLTANIKGYLITREDELPIGYTLNEKQFEEIATQIKSSLKIVENVDVWISKNVMH